MSFFNTAIVTTLPFVPKPIVAQFAKKYIAGETLSDAVAAVRQLNSVQAMTTIDALGEDVFTQEQAIVHRDQSIAVLNTIAEQKIDSNLSVKLTSFGLKIDKDFCRENFEAILAVAASHKIFVRIDMEDHTCTDDTLALYRTLRVKTPAPSRCTSVEFCCLRYRALAAWLIALRYAFTLPVITSVLAARPLNTYPSIAIFTNTSPIASCPHETDLIE